MNILKGHISAETAYVVADYPYGFRLRCKIRYWIEYKKNHGFRFVSQTTNPKRAGEAWNKPKAGTYSRFGMAMYLGDEGHVHHTGLSEYSGGAEAVAWAAKWRDGVPEAGLIALDSWVAAKAAYDANRKQDDPLHVGLPEAHKAWLDVAITEYEKKED
jgi:hypothetical protein